MRNTTDTRTARLVFALSLALALAFVFTLAATFVPVSWAGLVLRGRWRTRRGRWRSLGSLRGRGR